MAMRRAALGCFAVAGVCQAAASQDHVALLQASLEKLAESGASEVESEAATLSRLLTSEKAKAIVEQATHMSKNMGTTAPMERMKDAVAAGRQLVPGFEEKVSAAWKSLHARSKGFNNPDPQALLHEGKMALLETGALQAMRSFARATANKSRALSQGAVPLDSMIV
eukprot:CAMPEP_0171233596 /NCGR_PEP_ID=MMETSP0790-20130122/41001_1 /TAXON_ID=2925 /ORGANISM="Alexandrium catenella, Strain OF101" /LENGTH=166 /DNA_ID=CAMNT_0011699859 /DNA_START=57 /DNA_END=554 /DNA_ORIENTATION=+